MDEEIGRDGQFEPIGLSGVLGSCVRSVGVSPSITAGGSQGTVWLCAFVLCNKEFFCVFGGGCSGGGRVFCCYLCVCVCVCVCVIK